MLYFCRAYYLCKCVSGNYSNLIVMNIEYEKRIDLHAEQRDFTTCRTKNVRYIMYIYILSKLDFFFF